MEALSLPEAPRPAIPDASRRMVEIAGGLSLHVSELGEGEPVLMLHGWPEHAGCWRAVAPLLAERGYRVICPDLRGFGASDAPGHGYDPPTFAEDALALLEALEIDRVHLVGHDWGGYAGFLLALEEPECVSAYLACSTPVPWLRASPRLALQAWRSWYAVVLAAVGGPLSRQPETIAESIRGPGLSEEDAMEYAQLLARPESARATEQLYRSYLRTLIRLPFGGHAGEPARLTAPTRLLLGTRDPAVAREFVEGDHSAHADALEVELVEGAHHFVPEERPELVADRAAELFGGVRAAG